MTDLTARILAAIEQTASAERAKIRRAKWHPGRLCPICDQAVHSVTFDPKLPSPHVQLSLCGHQPAADQLIAAGFAESAADAATLRHCEADKRTVERHKPELIKSRQWCTHCERLWPCVEILDRADAYDIDTRETT
jgi:hypothetical protein